MTSRPSLLLTATLLLAIVISGSAAAVFAQETEAPPLTEGSSPPFEWHAFAEAAYQFNFNRPPGETNALRVFDTRDDRWQLHLVGLTLARSAAPIGFQVDLVAGDDAALFASQGAWNPRMGDFKQAVLSWKPGWGGLEIKGGKFVTTAGYEVIKEWSNLNPNFSHSYLFGYAIPFTHTGIRASVPAGGKVTFVAGVNRGWDKWADNNGALSTELGATVTPSQWLTLVFDTHQGPEQADDTNDIRRLYDFVATAKVAKSVTLGVNLDYATEENASVVRVGDRAVWYGWATYVVVAPTPRWSVALRLEEFRDRDGARTGLSQTLRDADVTFDLSLHKYVLLRTDVRADTSTAGVFEKRLSDGTGSGSRSQRTIALAVVFKR